MSTTTSTQVPTGTWQLDPVHSSIGFAVKHSGVMTFRGTFDEYDAKLVDGRLEGTAKVASVRVDDPNLAGHLQTPDFFDAEQYPELRFVSRTIQREGDRVDDRRRPDPARCHAARRDHRHRGRSHHRRPG